METSFVAWLRSVCPSHPALEVGLGDDAAVLTLPGGRLVATTDMLTEGVDFLLAEHDPRRIGHKALAVNLSDLAAMAARPLAVFISVALPTNEGAEASSPRTLCRHRSPGGHAMALPWQVGDTNSWTGGLVISITAAPARPTARKATLLRSGCPARRSDPGHRLVWRQHPGQTSRFRAARCRGSYYWPIATSCTPASMSAMTLVARPEPHGQRKRLRCPRSM